MSDTPKADALKDRYCLHGIDWYYLCSELERENAALRAEVKVTRQNWEDYKSENAALREAKDAYFKHNNILVKLMTEEQKKKALEILMSRPKEAQP